MIAGIGTDMVETDRVMEKISKESGFREHVFSASEIAYCEKMANKAESYAGKFAAKEALLKALGVGLSGGYVLNEMEIVNDESGRPFFHLTGTSLALIREKNIADIHVSITHIKSIASAVVVIGK